jgi:hypothetical protein
MELTDVRRNSILFPPVIVKSDSKCGWRFQLKNSLQGLFHVTHRHQHLHPWDKSVPSAAATTLKAGGSPVPLVCYTTLESILDLQDEPMEKFGIGAPNVNKG